MTRIAALRFPFVNSKCLNMVLSSALEVSDDSLRKLLQSLVMLIYHDLAILDTNCEMDRASWLEDPD